jgi:hypothetical protein
MMAKWTVREDPKNDERWHLLYGGKVVTDTNFDETGSAGWTLLERVARALNKMKARPE